MFSDPFCWARQLFYGTKCNSEVGHPAEGSYPILNAYSRHAGEFPHVVCDKNQAFAAGMAADLHVMHATGSASPLQLGMQLSIMCRSLVTERASRIARPRIGFHDVDADVGVKHIGEHQKGSRASASGCSRLTMKSSLSRGPLRNRSSHRRPWGTIRRLWPIFRIST